jgi:hypothetical protein
VHGCIPVAAQTRCWFRLKAFVCLGHRRPSLLWTGAMQSTLKISLGCFILYCSRPGIIDIEGMPCTGPSRLRFCTVPSPPSVISSVPTASSASRTSSLKHARFSHVSVFVEAQPNSHGRASIKHTLARDLSVRLPLEHFSPPSPLPAWFFHVQGPIIAHSAVSATTEQTEATMSGPIKERRIDWPNKRIYPGN